MYDLSVREFAQCISVVNNSNYFQVALELIPRSVIWKLSPAIDYLLICLKETYIL